MPLGKEVGLGLSEIVLDGDTAAVPEKGAEPPPICGLCILCQTAGWIKMQLGMEVGLGPGHIVLNGDPALPLKGHIVSQFSAHVYCCQMVANLSYC